MRLFFAIDLPDDLRPAVVATQRRWVARYDPDTLVSPTRPENLHVTLKFLGDVPDPAPLIDAVRSGLTPVGDIWLRTESVEYFPPRGPIRVIAVHIGGDIARLSQIFEQLESAAADLGFPRERRPFRPHVTIGRSRAGVTRSLHPEFLRPDWLQPSAPFRVSAVTLYQSTLTPAGPQYRPLASFPL